MSVFDFGTGRITPFVQRVHRTHPKTPNVGFADWIFSSSISFSPDGVKLLHLHSEVLHQFTTTGCVHIGRVTRCVLVQAKVRRFLGDASTGLVQGATLDTSSVTQAQQFSGLRHTHED